MNPRHLKLLFISRSGARLTCSCMLPSLGLFFTFLLSVGGITNFLTSSSLTRPSHFFFLLPIPAAAAPLPILCRDILCVHVYTVLLWTRARTFHHRSRRRVLRRHGPIAQRRKPDAMASSSSLVRVKIPGTHWYVPETTRLILSRVVSNVILVYRIGRCARRSLLSLRCV